MRAIQRDTYEQLCAQRTRCTDLENALAAAVHHKKRLYEDLADMTEARNVLAAVAKERQQQCLTT